MPCDFFNHWKISPVISFKHISSASKFIIDEVRFEEIIQKKSFRLLEKHLLMLRCLKRMKKLDADNPKLHSALMKFLKLSKRMRRRVSDEISDDGNSSSK